MNEAICASKYEAEYNRLLVELEQAKCEIDCIRERLNFAEHEINRLRAIKQTIEVVFGRSFDNAAD